LVSWLGNPGKGKPGLAWLAWLVRLVDRLVDRLVVGLVVRLSS